MLWAMEPCGIDYRSVMKLEPRFVQPAKGNRPRGSRLIEMYSVKLGRRVTAYSREQYEILLGVEIDSTVTIYCERPMLDGLASDACLSCSYHATIFQLASVTRWPIHDVRLATACQYCGFGIPLRLNAGCCWTALTSVRRAACALAERFRH